MSYTDVFGGSTIYPSQVSYLAVALSAANITLEWPLESDAPEYPAARILDVTSANSRSITLPDATLAGPGETILFNNLPASSTSFTVKDAAGTTVATVAVGTAWQLYLAGNATAAGTWRAYQMGASTATVNAADLAGYGLTVTSGELSQAMPVEELTVSPYTLAVTDRAKLIVWAGSGAGEIDLPSAATAGDNFFVAVRNDSEGMLTFTPAGSDLVDGDTSLVLQPGDSATLATDGADWFSVGLGQQPIFAFDYTLIDLTGAGTTYTLSGSELNRIAYSFTGTLSNNVNIVVPSNYQQYWVANNTTGAYTLSLSTDGGTPANINQNARAIMYCNGANVITADSGASISIPLSASQGGTGQTSYAVGDLLYASGVTTLDKLADVATGNALISGGVGAAPAWGKVGLTTHVSGTLPVANGGTGQTSYTDGQLLIGNSTGNTLTKATLTAGSNIVITNGSGAITIAVSAGVIATQANNSLSLGNSSAGTAGNNNTAVGNSAGAAVIAGGNDNTFYGYRAGTAITTGDNNIAVGSGALATVTTGSGNIAIGKNAGGSLGTTAANSVIIGLEALAASTGSDWQHTIVGAYAANAATTVSGALVAIGTLAASSATSINVANTAIGYSAMGSSSSVGSANTAVGAEALKYAAGDYNAVLGYRAGFGNGSHSNLTAVGALAGSGVTTGGTNTCVGYSSGSAITTGANNTILGSYTGSAALASNVVLSDGAGTRRFWHDATDAYVSHNTTASAANAYLDSGTNKLQRSTSSLRYKRDVEDLWSAEADKLLKLKPVFYRSKCDADPAEFSYYGVIAEQAHELGLQRLVQYEYAPEDYGEPDENNERWPKPDAVKVPGGFAYDRMTVLLLDLVQRQQARIEALEARIGA